ncbi:hypothetical protein [Kitasatospora sp. MBT63]|nr:hypothetical protein [Kitasatospora sp. MBT63]
MCALEGVQGFADGAVGAGPAGGVGQDHGGLLALVLGGEVPRLSPGTVR